MALTKSELIAALQNEIRILLHLTGKIEHSMLDYRPTPKQRSMRELLRYLSMMGPMLVQVATSEAGSFGREAWMAAKEAADARDFDDTLAVIAAQSDGYATVLGALSDADLAKPMAAFDGSQTTRGAFIVNLVLCGHAAYRMQLFLYLKACGVEALGTANLWRGADPAPPA
jgi:hypothetical protein